MDSAPAGEITILLHAWSEGDHDALARLTSLIYRELYTAAKRYMVRQDPGHLLQNTALVNEVYLRLAKLEEIQWRDRGHFFAFCAQAMRRILTDHARSELSLKAGGDIPRVPFDEASIRALGRSAQLLALDDALIDLAAIDKRKSQIIELRFFGGLSIAETAEVLNVSEGTVNRDWKFAKQWLLCELRGRNGGGT